MLGSARRIGKSPAEIAAANLADYEDCRARFRWSDARALLDGLPGGRGLNIAHEAVDRHAAGARAGRTALRWLARDGRVVDTTYAELARATNRFANVLGGLGVGPGERVYLLLGRIPEHDVAATGTLKARAVLRDELDLDSMDFLGFVTALDEQLHIAVPESDYERLATLDGCVAYLTADTAPTAPA